jgi:glucans biosynthesis protein C
METSDRKYFIDWIRVIAIGLLLVYHVAIGFQPWGIMIGFITAPESWPDLWLPMSMLNVWRIPLLFFVSGMGVYFAMQRRTWKELLRDRATRIMLPFLFGAIVIAPIHIMLWRYYNNMALVYTPGPAHLWFLGNIFCYVVILLPLLYYMKGNEQSGFSRVIRKVFASPAGILLVMGVFVLEVVLVKPFPFELYAMTWHGFIIGLLAFVFGFFFVSAGQPFWAMIQRWRWIFLIIGLFLFVRRTQFPSLMFQSYLIAVESVCWILTVLAFGSKHLNIPGRALTYLSEAAYPVYIVHMVFLYLGSVVIFRLPVSPQVIFILLLLFTIVGCFAAFEVVRRIGFLRIVFGLSARKRQERLLVNAGQ